MWWFYSALASHTVEPVPPPLLALVQSSWFVAHLHHTRLRHYTHVRWASSESLQQKITLERVKRQPHQHVAQIYMSEKGGMWCSKFQCTTLTSRAHGWARHWRSMRGARSQEPPGSGQIYVRILGMFKTLNSQCITSVAPESQTRKHPNNHLARIYIMT